MDRLAMLIRRRRLELRLTQREAAERAGVSHATWQTLERDSRQATTFHPLTLSGVAHALDLPLSEVFEAAGQPLPDHASGEDARGDDTAALVGELGDLLAALRDRSQDAFAFAYGQSVDLVRFLLHHLR